MQGKLCDNNSFQPISSQSSVFSADFKSIFNVFGHVLIRVPTRAAKSQVPPPGPPGTELKAKGLPPGLRGPPPGLTKKPGYKSISERIISQAGPLIMRVQGRRAPQTGRIPKSSRGKMPTPTTDSDRFGIFIRAGPAHSMLNCYSSCRGA